MLGEALLLRDALSFIGVIQRLVFAQPYRRTAERLKPAAYVYLRVTFATEV
jgi:hypothetical protein